MNVIQDITSQTTLGTKTTAESVGQLAENATELREFVAGFKLPSSFTPSDSDDFGFRAPAPEAAFEAADSAEEEVDEFELASDADESEEESYTAYAQSDELDVSYEEPERADDDTEEVEFAATAPNASTVSELEAELAGVDLDEFSIDESDNDTNKNA
jgi:hypothetical protein